MATVRQAKEKITVYLKAKGLDAAEIKDAFDELDAADVDLGKLAGDLGEYKKVNQQWVDYFNAVSPEVQAAVQERDALKGQIEKLRAAGISVGATAPTTPKADASGYVTAEDLKKFQGEMAKATSQVMKQLNKVSMTHFRTFNKEADIDAIEAIMNEGKASNVEEAYRIWSKPEYDKKQDDDTAAKIAQGIKEGMQDQMSKLGISRSRKRKEDEIEPADLKKPAPTERELRDAFVQDLNSDTTH